MEADVKELDVAIFECSGGATVQSAAREAYEITKNLGFYKVYIKHNETLYRVELTAKEEGK